MKNEKTRTTKLLEIANDTTSRFVIEGMKLIKAGFDENLLRTGKRKI